MTSTTFFLVFIPILAIILLAVNFIFAPHNPYQEKNSTFECGFHSFLGQNRTQFSVSFFIFALLFLLFDLEILLVYPYVVSAYTNGIYGLIVMLIFFLALTLGFAFELGKNALKIESRQTIIKFYSNLTNNKVFIEHFNNRYYNSILESQILGSFFKYFTLLNVLTAFVGIVVVYIIKEYGIAASILKLIDIELTTNRIWFISAFFGMISRFGFKGVMEDFLNDYIDPLRSTFFKSKQPLGPGIGVKYPTRYDNIDPALPRVYGPDSGLNFTTGYENIDPALRPGFGSGSGSGSGSGQAAEPASGQISASGSGPIAVQPSGSGKASGLVGGQASNTSANPGIGQASNASANPGIGQASNASRNPSISQLLNTRANPGTCQASSTSGNPGTNFTPDENLAPVIKQRLLLAHRLKEIRYQEMLDVIKANPSLTPDHFDWKGLELRAMNISLRYRANYNWNRLPKLHSEIEYHVNIYRRLFPEAFYKNNPGKTTLEQLIVHLENNRNV